MNIFELVKSSPKLICGKECNSATIDLCQKRLCAYGAAPMPISYTSFLKQINGICNDGVSLFGIDVQGMFDDVFTKNSLTNSPSSHCVFLGENLTEFLCYEWHKKSYIILSKYDNSETRSFANLEAALLHILKNELE